MAVVASSVLNRVRTQLIDDGSTVRWTDSELLSWLSDGQRAVVSFVPHAAPRTANLSLVAGNRQTIPTDGWRLITIYRNTTSGGGAGTSALEVPRSVLDIQYPTWTSSATSSVTVTHWCYDERDPSVFWVYPYNTGAGYVQINYSYMPPDLASTAEELDLRDIFQTALFDYVMFRAHSKDSDYAAGQALAAAYFSSFQAHLAPFMPARAA
jgi:hypothetical protein